MAKNASLLTQLKASIPMVKALRQEIMILLITLLLGLLIGWFAFGWGIAPVEWTDAAPSTLQANHRSFYLRLLSMADQAGRLTPDDFTTYVITPSWTANQIRAELNQLISSDTVNAAHYQYLLTRIESISPTVPESSALESNSASLLDSPLSILAIVVIGVIVISLGIVIVRRTGGGASDGAMGNVTSFGAPVASQSTGTLAADAGWGESGAPLLEGSFTYLLGNDHFDQSYAIETSDSVFLGELGVGIGDTIGVGEPDKVNALEVWLFDKNDIRTVTMVVMSEHAYNDDSLRTKLDAKGDESFLAQPGLIIPLETQSLLIKARIEELEYGTGQLPTNSFFQKIQITMAAWQIGDGGVTQPASDILTTA